MSDESRAKLCPSSRGEEQDMTSDDYEQGRVRGVETTQGAEDESRMDCRADGSEGGAQEKVWRALEDSLWSQGPLEQNHILRNRQSCGESEL